MTHLIFLNIIYCWPIKVNSFAWIVRRRLRATDIYHDSISIELISSLCYMVTCLFVFISLFIFLWNLYFWQFFELSQKFLFPFIFLHNFIVAILFIFKVSMRFFWIKLLFLWGIWSIYLSRSRLVASCLVFHGWLLIEIRIFYVKMRCISEKVIDLFFAIDTLKCIWRSYSASKISKLFLLNFLIKDERTIMLDLFVKLRFTIIYFKICGWSSGLARLVNCRDVQSDVVLMLKKGAFHYYYFIVKNKNIKWGIWLFYLNNYFLQAWKAKIYLSYLISGSFSS